LYIAHNLGALPAAALAARRYGARLGFDAEDYHRGQFADGTADGRAIVQAFEERYLPLCDYVTAASPGIADAYAPLCQTKPDVILNVFPLADRPPSPPARADGRIRLYWFSQLIGGGRGLEHVASALGQLQDLPVELHVRGTWQPGFAARLSDIVRGAGGSPDRLVSHGPGAPSEMARLAAACDVGLALEIGDTRNSGLALSNKIFTYLLAGLPVLATATEAQAALGRELGPAIALTPIGDVRGMADAIRRWATDLAALAAARQAAWALAETRYNWDIEQQRFLRVVRTALGDRSRRHPEGVAS
jgi:glycosyltransferase involved in cell wall biosynthesis